MVSDNEGGYGNLQDHTEDNTIPIPVKHDRQKPFFGRLKLRMQSEIEPKRSHLILICLFFVTGLVDSAAYNIWSCFVSMQTGRLSPSVPQNSRAYN